MLPILKTVAVYSLGHWKLAAAKKKGKMLEALTLIIGGTIATLLPIANPFGIAPVFAAITQNYTENERKRQARMAAMYMTGILLVTLFAGAIVLKFFGVGIPALRIAGGLLIAKVGFSMVNPSQQQRVSEDSETEAMQKKDIAFTPIAMPLLSGPGSMAATLSMASIATGPANYIGIAIGICVVALISLLILRSATVVADFLGVAGMDALTRVMGLILVCIGIRFIATGLLEALTDPLIMVPIVEAIQQAANR